MIRPTLTGSVSKVVKAALVGAFLVANPIGAQERPGDQIFSLIVSQEFGANDNLNLSADSPGTTTWSDTGLTLGFRNETPNQFIDLRLRGVYRFVEFPDNSTENGFRDQSARIIYSRESLNSRLSFNLSYERPDLAFLNPLTQPDIDDQDIFRGGGTREDIRGNFVFETGRQAPIGLLLTATTRQRDYSNTTDPLLFDNETNTASATTFFRFNSITSGTLTLTERRYSAEDLNGRRVNTSTATVGFIHNFTQNDFLSANIGYSEVDEFFDNADIENDRRSTVGNITYRRVLSDGFFLATLNSQLTERGQENTFRFGRDTAFLASNFSWRLGFAQGENVDLQPIGLLRYDIVLPSGSLTALLSREVDINSNIAQFTRTTRARLDYRYDVNSLSNLRFSLDYADISLAGNNTSGAGRDRATLRAEYSRSVTRDWRLNLGYEHRLFRPAVGEDANSNQVTVSLSRAFERFQ